MNQYLLITIFSLTIISLFSPVYGQRPDKLTYQGKIYQVTEIVEVNGQNATLKTTEVQKDGTKKLVTIPIKFLSTRFKLKAESIQKGTGKYLTALSVLSSNASETEKAIQKSIIEGTALKRWIKGTASNESTEEGALVVSSSSALELKINRSGEALPPKKVKGNAIFYNFTDYFRNIYFNIWCTDINSIYAPDKFYFFSQFLYLFFIFKQTSY